ncbi:MAG: hypothetical protein AAGC55_18735, partial [Myxococcota bacterium]
DGRGSILVDKNRPGEGGDKGKRGKRGAFGIKTQLEFDDYKRIVGDDKVEQEIALGRQKKRSKRRGRWERKLGAVKSALENFTPEIRPGNQTALKTRAAPFAVYIARMHRRIHELFTFGFLDDLDKKGADHPLNDWNLHTKIEFAVNPDGTLAEDRIRIVKHSGRLEFDVAAIDALLTAAPYESPPKKIRSPDGRAWMHWGFYRNHRACGTFNVQPFILKDPPKGSDNAGDASLVRSLPRSRRRGTSNSTAQDGAKPSAGATSAAGRPLSPEDPNAVHTANVWIRAFSQRNVNKMLTATKTPFRTGRSSMANRPSDVANIYRLVLSENRGRVRDWKLMTAAGYRKRFGATPAGIEVSASQLLMVVRVAKEQFTLVLERQSDGQYRVAGLHR